MNLKRSYDSRNVKYYLLLIEGRFHLSLIFFYVGLRIHFKRKAINI